MKTKRNFLISILTIVMAVCAFMGVLGVTNAASVKAEGQTFYVDNYFSVKTDEGAIRFYTVMDAETKALAEKNGYGFFIFPHSYFTEVAALDKADFHNTLPKKVAIEGNANGTSKIYSYEEGLYATNAVIKNLQYESFGIEFTCVAFVKNDDGTYTYAYNEDLGVSAYEELSATYLSGLDDVDYETIMATYGDHADESRTNYSFGKNNPILITNESQVGVLAANVADGVDTYEGLNFKLAENITLANGASIPSAFAGSIDGDGKKVTAEFAAVLVEGKTATELNYVEDIKAPANYVNFATDYVGYDAKNNPDGEKGRLYQLQVGDNNTKGQVMTKEEWTADGVTGDYAGTLMKAGGNYRQRWTLNPIYSNAQLDAISSYFDYVSFYVAAIETDETATALSYPLNCFSYSGTYALRQSFTLDTADGALVKVQVPIDAFVTATKAGETLQLFSVGWGSKTTPSGSVSGNSATLTLNMYFSELTFEKEDVSYLVRIGQNETAISRATDSQTMEIISTEQATTDGIIAGAKGIYTGSNVLKIHKSQFETNTLAYYLTFRQFNARQKAEILDTYTHVSIWVATTGINFPTGGLYNLTTTGNDWSHSNGKWMNYMITVEEYFNYLDANSSDGKVLLMKTYVSDKTKAPDAVIYFGDIEFVEKTAE